MVLFVVLRILHALLVLAFELSAFQSLFLHKVGAQAIRLTVPVACSSRERWSRVRRHNAHSDQRKKACPNGLVNDALLKLVVSPSIIWFSRRLTPVNFLAKSTLCQG
jgi:hypothetical protein